MRKFGLFTKHPRISIETVDLFASKQNLARCEAKEVTARQDKASQLHSDTNRKRVCKPKAH